MPGIEHVHKENINFKLKEKIKMGVRGRGEKKKKVSGYLYKLSFLCFREGSCPLSGPSTLSLITGFALIEWGDVSQGEKHVENLLTMCVIPDVNM